MRVSLLIGLVLALVVGSAQAADPVPACEADTGACDIRLGVLAYRGDGHALKTWQPTVAYLNQALAPYRFHLRPMDHAELRNAVALKRVDYALTNPGQFVQLNREFGLSWLLTIRSERHQNPLKAIGTALWVRADSPYRSLDDLRGARLMAVGETAFGGYRVAKYELLKHDNIRIPDYFSSIAFTGLPVDRLLYALAQHQTDAVIAPSCLLEDMNAEGALSAQAFRLINPQPHEGYNCQSSSRHLFPNWPLAEVATDNPALTERLVAALYRLGPANDTGTLWQFPASTHEIQKLTRELAKPANWREELILLWTQFKNWSWLILSLIGALLILNLWVDHRVRLRTRQLRNANRSLKAEIDAHQQTSAALKQKQLALAMAQRMAVVGETSANLAHELNQPLAAINGYIDGCVRRLGRDALDRDTLAMVLDKIQSQSQRCVNIVEHTRDLVRETQLNKERVAIADLLQEVLDLLELDLKQREVPIHLDIAEDLVEFNLCRSAIQQVLINLVLNSLKALGQTRDARITIQARQSHDNGSLYLRVVDNGPGIPVELRGKLFDSYSRPSREGLGLGLAICRRLVEAHQGEVALEETLQGSSIVLRIPSTAL